MTTMEWFFWSAIESRFDKQWPIPSNFMVFYLYVSFVCWFFRCCSSPTFIWMLCSSFLCVRCTLILFLCLCVEFPLFVYLMRVDRVHCKRYGHSKCLVSIFFPFFPQLVKRSLRAAWTLAVQQNGSKIEEKMKCAQNEPKLRKRETKQKMHHQKLNGMETYTLNNKKDERFHRQNIETCAMIMCQENLCCKMMMMMMMKSK